MPNTERFRNISDQLERRLREDSAFALPSIPNLARMYGVSKMTMWKAVRLLAARGLVQCTRGRRISRVEQRQALRTSSPAESADSRFYDKIKRGILDGHFRAGEQLPKFDYFITTHHVSPVTITQAMTRLSGEGLIHKQGKRWITGARPNTPYEAPFSAGRSPTVLFLRTGTYQDTVYNFFTMPFITMLRAELGRRGVRLSMGQRMEDVPEGLFVPNRGMQEVRHAIRELAELYRGAVILDPFISDEDLVAWVKVLSCSGAKPVVYFDHSGGRPMFSRHELSLHDAYYRLYMDEPAAVSLALDYLVRRGHRVIGISSVPWKYHAWTKWRAALIKRIASRMDPRPRIVDTVHTERFWIHAGRADISDARHFYEEILHALQRRKPRTMPGTARGNLSPGDVIGLFPSMKRFLDEGVTALLSPNDWLALQHNLWCAMAGISVPRDLSILSFDNDPLTTVFPISTVDFGMARLGYLAARILSGKREEDAARNGEVPGICLIVNNGSVAEAEVRGR